MALPPPTLYILSGLPGTGKSTLARALAQRLSAAHLRIDTIEQALRDLLNVDVVSEGYRLAYRVAGDLLSAGSSVIADSCNPLELTRREWEQVARSAGATHLNIEVVCSDTLEHRRRVERRAPSIPGLRMPTWADVEAREYHEWTTERIVLDTAARSEAQSVDELIHHLRRPEP